MTDFKISLFSASDKIGSVFLNVCHMVKPVQVSKFLLKQTDSSNNNGLYMDYVSFKLNRIGDVNFEIVAENSKTGITILINILASFIRYHPLIKTAPEATILLLLVPF